MQSIRIISSSQIKTFLSSSLTVYKYADFLSLIRSILHIYPCHIFFFLISNFSYNSLWNLAFTYQIVFLTSFLITLYLSKAPLHHYSSSSLYKKLCLILITFIICSFYHDMFLHSRTLSFNSLNIFYLSLNTANYFISYCIEIILSLYFTYASCITLSTKTLRLFSICHYLILRANLCSKTLFWPSN